ncbi:MarR family winged helix-turn-helix transcriptional regulator [Rhodococcus sp. C26F]
MVVGERRTFGRTYTGEAATSAGAVATIMQSMDQPDRSALEVPSRGRVSPSSVSGFGFGDVAARLTRERYSGLDDQAVALGLTIIRASNAHMQESERRIHRPHGWSWSGFHIMYMIWLFGEIEARDLARLSGVSRQTTSSVLANLEANGFVNRERTSDTDKRLVTVTLTPKGAAAIDEAFAQQNALETEWFGCLSTEERDQLKNLLDRVTRQIKDSKHNTR